MDEQTKQYLKNILSKSPEALTEDDKAFMRARQSYIGKKEQAQFASVFGSVPEEKKDTKETTVMEKLEKNIDPMAHPGTIVDPTDDDDDDQDDPTDIV